MDFRKNVVIITGASAGIGRALALLMAKQGAYLALAARNADSLNEVAGLCEKEGGRAIAVPTDVSDPESCKNLIDKTIDAYGKINTLINNAGISMWVPFIEIRDISMFERIMRVNYLGSVYCTYYALPYLQKTGGRLVAVSSLTGKTGVPTRTAYAASKHAMAGFFDSLRVELMATDVSVTVIYPGFVATRVRERALGADGKPLGKSHLNESNVMTAEDCAKDIVKAVAGRKRELIMTTKARVGMWLKLVAPRLVDKIALKSIQKGKT